jgi:hypothetical protein
VSEPGGTNEPAYHLYLDPEEVPVAARAVRLLIADEAHEPAIRRIAREVLGKLEEPYDERLTVALEPAQMKITFSAVRLLLNDTQRGEGKEREALWGILEKLPDEHTMRAIELE